MHEGSPRYSRLVPEARCHLSLVHKTSSFLVAYVLPVFNHAEESLQDGSHLFSTQHPWASTARAVINLEAAGTTGRELLFQATSEQMIEAYSHVPRPYGTVFANEIFSSGIILSEYVVTYSVR